MKAILPAMGLIALLELPANAGAEEVNPKTTPAINMLDYCRPVLAAEISPERAFTIPGLDTVQKTAHAYQCWGAFDALYMVIWLSNTAGKEQAFARI